MGKALHFHEKVFRTEALCFVVAQLQAVYFSLSFFWKVK